MVGMDTEDYWISQGMDRLGAQQMASFYASKPTSIQPSQPGVMTGAGVQPAPETPTETAAKFSSATSQAAKEVGLKPEVVYTRQYVTDSPGSAFGHWEEVPTALVPQKQIIEAAIAAKVNPYESDPNSDQYLAVVKGQEERYGKYYEPSEWTPEQRRYSGQLAQAAGTWQGGALGRGIVTRVLMPLHIEGGYADVPESEQAKYVNPLTGESTFRIGNANDAALAALSRFHARDPSYAETGRPGSATATAREYAAMRQYYETDKDVIAADVAAHGGGAINPYVASGVTNKMLQGLITFGYTSPGYDPRASMRGDEIGTIAVQSFITPAYIRSSVPADVFKTGAGALNPAYYNENTGQYELRTGVFSHADSKDIVTKVEALQLESSGFGRGGDVYFFSEISRDLAPLKKNQITIGATVEPREKVVTEPAVVMVRAPDGTMQPDYMVPYGNVSATKSQVRGTGADIMTAGSYDIYSGRRPFVSSATPELPTPFVSGTIIKPTGIIEPTTVMIPFTNIPVSTPRIDIPIQEIKDTIAYFQPSVFVSGRATSVREVPLSALGGVEYSSTLVSPETGKPVKEITRPVGDSYIKDVINPSTGAMERVSVQDYETVSLPESVRVYEFSAVPIRSEYDVAVDTNIRSRLPSIESGERALYFVDTVLKASPVGIARGLPEYGGAVIQGTGSALGAPSQLMSMQREQQAIASSITSPTEGQYRFFYEHPETTVVSYALGGVLGGVTRGASAVASRVPTLAKASPYIGKFGGYALGTMYAGGVVYSETQDFSEFTPDTISQVKARFTQEGVPLTFGFAHGYGIPELAGFTGRSIRKLPSVASEKIFEIRQNLAGIERIEAGSPYFEDVYPIRPVTPESAPTFESLGGRAPVSQEGVISIRAASDYGGLTLTKPQALEYIKARYPGQEAIWDRYLTDTQLINLKYESAGKVQDRPKSPIVYDSGVAWNTAKSDFASVQYDINVMATGKIAPQQLQQVTRLTWMTPQEMKLKQIEMFSQRGSDKSGLEIFEFRRNFDPNYSVEELKSSMESGDVYTPLTLFYDRFGKIDTNMQEGAHRTHALLDLGVEKIPVWETYQKGIERGKEYLPYPETQNIISSRRDYWIGDKPTAKITTPEAAAYIRERYPGQEAIWDRYLTDVQMVPARKPSRLDRMDVSLKLDPSEVLPIVDLSPSAMQDWRYPSRQLATPPEPYAIVGKTRYEYSDLLAEMSAPREYSIRPMEDLPGIRPTLVGEEMGSVSLETQIGFTQVSKTKTSGSWLLDEMLRQQSFQLQPESPQTISFKLGRIESISGIPKPTIATTPIAERPAQMFESRLTQSDLNRLGMRVESIRTPQSVGRSTSRGIEFGGAPMSQKMLNMVTTVKPISTPSKYTSNLDIDISVGVAKSRIRQPVSLAEQLTMVPSATEKTFSEKETPLENFEETLMGVLQSEKRESPSPQVMVYGYELYDIPGASSYIKRRPIYKQRENIFGSMGFVTRGGGVSVMESGVAGMPVPSSGIRGYGDIALQPRPSARDNKVSPLSLQRRDVETSRQLELYDMSGVKQLRVSASVAAIPSIAKSMMIGTSGLSQLLTKTITEPLVTTRGGVSGRTLVNEITQSKPKLTDPKFEITPYRVVLPPKEPPKLPGQSPQQWGAGAGGSGNMRAFVFRESLAVKTAGEIMFGKSSKKSYKGKRR